MWRLNARSEAPLEVLNAQNLMMGDLPERMASEVTSLNIWATSETIPPPVKQKLTFLSNNLRKLNHLEAIYSDGEFAEGPFSDAIKQLCQQPFLKELSVQGKGSKSKVASDLLSNLLASPNLNIHARPNQTKLGLSPSMAGS